jgi:hypothetical protein
LISLSESFHISPSCVATPSKHLLSTSTSNLTMSETEKQSRLSEDNPKRPSVSSDGRTASVAKPAGDAASSTHKPEKDKEAAVDAAPKPPREIHGVKWFIAVIAIVSSILLYATDNTIVRCFQPPHGEAKSPAPGEMGERHRPQKVDSLHIRE